MLQYNDRTKKVLIAANASIKHNGEILCFCPRCKGKELTGKILTHKNKIQMLSSEKKKFFFVEPKNDGNVYFTRCVLSVKNELIILKEESAVIFHPDGTFGVYTLKNGVKNKPCKSQKVFGVTTKLFLEDATADMPIVWDASSRDEFLLNNQFFAKVSGLDFVIHNINTAFHEDILTILYLSLYVEHKAIELLIKMNYHQFLIAILVEIASSYNKNEINTVIDDIGKMISEESSGIKAINMPRYIFTYLCDVKSNWEEFFAWTEIYSLSAKYLSKEKFEKYLTLSNRVNSSSYRYYNNHSQSVISNPNKILDIVKHGGYEDPYKTVSYCVKQAEVLEEERKAHLTSASNYAERTPITLHSVCTLLSDYLNMCDSLDVTYEVYPKNIKELHDSLSKRMKELKISQYDAKIKEVGGKCNEKVKAMNDSSDEYVVLFPESAKEFVAEGAAQHNCVGSYASSVAEKRTKVFFIRQKESPQNSYVTAEVRKGKVHQCVYRCNRQVYDEDILAISKKVASLVERV